MSPKILQIVNSCGICLNYRYYSGGKYVCTGVHEIVEDKSLIAPFCPLVDFPSRIIANMERTIQTLREPNKYGMVLAILSHVATKLKVNMDAYGMSIPIKDNDSIYLKHDAITEITTFPYALYFIFGEKNFKLIPDGDKPHLYEMVLRDELPDKELWVELYLK